MTATTRTAVAALLALLLAACNRAPETTSTSVPSGQDPVTGEQVLAKEGVRLMHVHGLEYSPDGSKILIPSHLGLAVYDRSTSDWSVADGPTHDYMGFSATKDAIYSSGHPAPGSGFVNPFGIIKSRDGGQTWQKLGFEGETDFHLLAAGYETNSVYVINPHPNSKLKEEGLYYTLNDGFTWERALATGPQGSPMSLAVHPTDPRTVAMGTDHGLFLSHDAGTTFQKISSKEASAAFFDLDGQHLWFGLTGGQSDLVRLNLENRESTEIALPQLNKDAVAYIAQNPTDRSEYAVATLQRNVLLSTDNGQSWKLIAKNGEAS